MHLKRKASGGKWQSKGEGTRIMMCVCVAEILFLFSR